MAIAAPSAEKRNTLNPICTEGSLQRLIRGRRVCFGDPVTAFDVAAFTLPLLHHCKMSAMHIVVSVASG